MPCEGRAERGGASRANEHLRLPESQPKLGGERPRTGFLTACRRTLTQLWEEGSGRLPGGGGDRAGVRTEQQVQVEGVEWDVKMALQAMGVAKAKAGMRNRQGGHWW